MTLGQGEQRLIRIPGLARYSLGSTIVRSLISPQSRGDALLLKAVSPGQTDLWVWKKDGTTERRSVRVIEWRPEESKIGLALEKAISRLEEVEVILSGGIPREEKDAEKSDSFSRGLQSGYVLRGEVSSLREASRIVSLRESFPRWIADETLPSPTLFASGDRALRGWLEGSRYRDSLSVDRFDETRTLWIRGSLDDPREREEVEKRARVLYPFVKLDLSTLPDASPTIHFKVFLLEMKKNKMRTLGLDWNGIVPSALSVSRFGLSDALRLEAALNAMEGEGSAKILSRPELVVRAPGEAELFAGGELPIETRTPYNSQVTWRQFGLLLRLKVLNVTRKKVRVDVTTEVSQLDPTIALKSIPGVQANRMKTQVDAAFGKPLLLSGLLQEGVRKSTRGLPALSRLPVLGSLFGSKDYQADRSELVAILVPATEPPPPPPPEKIFRRSARKRRPVKLAQPQPEKSPLEVML